MSTASKTIRLSIAMIALVVLTTGCSSVNTSYGVSPLSFFLPGLVKTAPPPAPVESAVPAADLVEATVPTE